MAERPSALAAQLAGARANPGPAALATVTGLLNGATMVYGRPPSAGPPTIWCCRPCPGPRCRRRPGWGSAALILGVSVVRWATILVRGLATGRVQYRAQAETRRRVAHRYLDLGPSWHRRHPPGRLLAHAISDVDALWSPMQFAYFAAGMVFMLLLALAELVRRDPALGLVGLALVVLVLGLNVTYQRRLAPRARAAQAARGVVGGVAHESIEGGPVVRSLGLAEQEAARFAAAVGRLRDADLRIAAVSSIFDRCWSCCRPSPSWPTWRSGRRGPGPAASSPSATWSCWCTAGSSLCPCSSSPRWPSARCSGCSG
ncbi:ABC transporter transmembrane domain-containing protein [Dactylosporangium sp. CA-139066]|uniref:ABC transporter transmembrane domain-containing protein n=1 Tax=Dactylosporangium sp. CA-139066 TaxID=3239930 RepID=UPI003D8A425D